MTMATRYCARNATRGSTLFVTTNLPNTFPMYTSAQTVSREPSTQKALLRSNASEEKYIASASAKADRKHQPRTLRSEPRIPTAPYNLMAGQCKLTGTFNTPLIGRVVAHETSHRPTSVPRRAIVLLDLWALLAKRQLSCQHHENEAARLCSMATVLSNHPRTQRLLSRTTRPSSCTSIDNPNHPQLIPTRTPASMSQTT